MEIKEGRGGSSKLCWKVTFEERLEEGGSHGGRGVPGANRLSRGCETGREVKVAKDKGIGGIAESSEGG